jgi:orotidine-5'-phosphate decarboxylase
MNRQALIHQIKSKGTYLCVGLDTDPEKIPESLLDHPDSIYEFNRQIIDATMDHCVSYKINTAFYEAMGARGWEIMERTIAHIPATHLIIADAKRGDIGNTSAQYAKAFFATMKADAITVAPYMGEDSIRPFLEYPDKWTIVLGLTSNKGAADFELQDSGGQKLYERVLETVSRWGSPENLMFVVGATQADEFLNIRKLVPDHFLLVPGVGAQGGSLAEISAKAMNKDIGLLVNASRAVIYASSGADFADQARQAAAAYHDEMRQYLNGF